METQILFSAHIAKSAKKPPQNVIDYGNTVPDCQTNSPDLVLRDNSPNSTVQHQPLQLNQPLQTLQKRRDYLLFCKNN